MDYNQEILKIKLQESKAEVDKKTIDFVSENGEAKINIQFSQKINEIVYKGENIDSELIAIINQAIATAKMNFDKEMFQVVQGLGIKM